MDSIVRHYVKTQLLIVAMVFCVIHIAVSSNTTKCSLKATQATRERFNKIISDEKFKFVYLNLKFLDIEFETREFAFLSNTDDVIDPLTWVLAIGGRGELLLGCPFDFRYVSLGTLSTSGVTSADINIIDSSKCFQGNESADEEKLNAIVDLVSQLYMDATQMLETDDSNSNMIDLKTVQICVEKQSNKTQYIYRNKVNSQKLVQRLSKSSHNILQYTSEYQCWYPNENTVQPFIVPRDITTPVFDAIINTIAIFLILLSPHIFFQVFKWTHPPKDSKYGKIIRIDTQPYPFGFLHCVFYSTYCGTPCTSGKCSFWCWIRYLLFFGFMCFLCCIQFIPLSYVDQENYKLRQMAAERLGVWRFDWPNNVLTYWAIVMIFLTIVGFNILNVSINRRQRTEDRDQSSIDDTIGRSYFTRLLFPLEEDKEIVQIICPDERTIGLEDTPFFWKIWEVLNLLWFGENRHWASKLALSAFVIVNWIAHIVPLIYYTTIVATILASLVHRSCCGRCSDNVEEGRRNVEQRFFRVTCLLFVLTIWFGVIFVLVTVPVFCAMFVACTQLIEIVGYTMVGVIVNAKYVLPWLVYSLGIATFLVSSVTAYSNAYAKLFYEIFETVESLDTQLDYHPVSRDMDDGVPQIEQQFFQDVAYKIKPWRRALSFVWIKLGCVFVFFAVGIAILEYVDGLGDLKGQSDLLGAIVLGGIPSLLSLLTSSSATVSCQSKAKKRKLETLIKKTASETEKIKRSSKRRHDHVEPEVNRPQRPATDDVQRDTVQAANVVIEGSLAPSRVTNINTGEEETPVA